MKDNLPSAKSLLRVYALLSLTSALLLSSCAAISPVTLPVSPPLIPPAPAIQEPPPSGHYSKMLSMSQNRTMQLQERLRKALRDTPPK